MTQRLKRVSVFCGSARGEDPAFSEAAGATGRALVSRGIGLVYGGGGIGLMTDVADAVLDRGGEAIGVIPGKLEAREVGHKALTEMHVVDTMHERKAKMYDLSDAFCVLPGGYGTLDELFECITWSQIGFHSKPVGLLNVSGFHDPLIAFVDHAVRQGFIKPKYRELMIVSDDPGDLLDKLESSLERPSWNQSSANINES